MVDSGAPADPSDGVVVGVMDVGGSHVTAAVVRPDAPATPLGEAGSAVDPHASLDALLDQLAAPGRSLAATTTVRGWSVAMPGPFDAAAGRGTFAGVEKFRSLAGVDLRAGLAERLGVDAGSVRFTNDAVAYGIGEWASGAGGRVDRMICITLGTGVGSAFLVDGHEVADGDAVPEAGEVHRLTIDGRPLEDTVSTRALRAAYHRRTGTEATVQEICALARAGDGTAAEVVGTAMRALGAAVAPWVLRFSASRIVVGGSIARSWDVIGAPLRDGLTGTGTGTGTGVEAGAAVRAGAADAAPAAVVPALLGPRAPLAGAAVAWEREATGR